MLEQYIQSEWGLEAIFCPSKARWGIAELFNSSPAFQMNQYRQDLRCNYIIVELTVNENIATLVNNYGLNKD